MASDSVAVLWSYPLTAIQYLYTMSIRGEGADDMLDTSEVYTTERRSTGEWTEGQITWYCGKNSQEK